MQASVAVQVLVIVKFPGQSPDVVDWLNATLTLPSQTSLAVTFPGGSGILSHETVTSPGTLDTLADPHHL